jgi:hypothetical protein
LGKLINTKYLVNHVLKELRRRQVCRLLIFSDEGYGVPMGILMEMDTLMETLMEMESGYR